MSLSFEQAQFEINNLLRQHAQGATSGASTVPGYGEALAKARYEAMLRHARSLYDSAGNAQTQQQDQAMAQTQHDEEMRRAQQDEMIRRAQHDESLRRMQMDHTISTGGQSIIPGTNGTGTQQPFEGMAPTGPFVPDGKGYAPTTGPWDLLPAYPGPYTPDGKRATPFNPAWDMPAYPGPFTPDPYPAAPTPTSGVVPGAPETVPYNGGPMTKSFTPGGSWNPGLVSPATVKGAASPFADGYMLNQTGLTPSLFKGTEIATGVSATKPAGDAGFMPWGAGRGGTDVMRGGNQAFGGFGTSTKPTTDTWRPDTSYNQASRNAGYGSGDNPAWMNFMGGAPPPVLDQRYNNYVSAFGSPTWTANG